MDQRQNLSIMKNVGNQMSTTSTGPEIVNNVHCAYAVEVSFSASSEAANMRLGCRVDYTP